MPRFPRPRRIVAATVLAMLALPGHAQMASFKNFKRYPTSGQWQQELVGYRDNKPLGPPVTSTTCASPFDPKASPAIMQAAKGAAPSCTTKILNDQEQMAEFETTCKVGSGVQTLHAQLRAIDDRTMAMDTRSTMPGMPETLMKSKVTYLGPCSAEAAAGPKPTAADCADLVKMRRDNEAAGGAAQCATLPAQYRSQCETQMAAGTKMMASLEAQCK